MVGLRAEAVGWVDDAFPGWIEVRFGDAAGKRWSVVDKVAIFDAPQGLGPESVYPVAVRVGCVVVETGTAGDLVTVSTAANGVAAADGEDTFTVRREQLVW